MPESLADQAVAALAAIKAMDEGLDLECPERHVVRGLRRHAENLVAEALRNAHALVYVAQDVRELIKKGGT